MTSEREQKETFAEDAKVVVFVASCNVDLVSYVDRMPLIGETLQGERFEQGFGGKGANKCIACSRLGSKCAVIAKLGNDTFGRDYLANFERNKIDTEHVLFTDEAATGVAPIYVDKNGNNSIVVILGANLLLSSEDIEAGCEKLFSRGNAAMLVANLELPFGTVLSALKLAKKQKLITLLNFAPASDEAVARCAELFEHTDFLILNEIEACQLLKTSTTTATPTKMSLEEARKTSQKVLAKLFNLQRGGSGGVIVTLGEQGVLYTTKKSSDNNECHHFHASCAKGVQVVDTTGAGDAFVGSFAHYLNKLDEEQCNVERALQLACDYASLTVEHKGTQSSYPELSKIDSRFSL